MLQPLKTSMEGFGIPEIRASSVWGLGFVGLFVAEVPKTLNPIYP